MSGLINSVKGALRPVARMAVDCGLVRRMALIRMDGGICSQMHFLMAGKILEQQGLHVVYDLSWFDRDGKDLDGRFDRKFELTHVFPDVRIESVGRWSLERQIYISFFYIRNDYFGDRSDRPAWTGVTSPAYIDGYFRDVEEMYGENFRSEFKPDFGILDENSLILEKRIREGNACGSSCAVHVRRGDLSRFNKAYGTPAEEEYFIESIRRLGMENDGKMRYFIFSDEPEWCREHLLPHLGGRDVTVCDANDSGHAGRDLLLLSECRHIITSQGSMGKYAALLREESLQEGTVTFTDNPGNDLWARRFKRGIIIG